MGKLTLRKSLKLLSFYCDECSQDIAPKLDSFTLKAFRNFELTKDESIRRLKIAHCRHKHSQYDSLREKIEAELVAEGKPRNFSKFRAKIQAKKILRLDSIHINDI